MATFLDQQDPYAGIAAPLPGPPPGPQSAPAMPPRISGPPAAPPPAPMGYDRLPDGSERPTRGGPRDPAAASGLNPTAVHGLAEQWLATRQMPALGMASPEARIAVLNEADRIVGAQGLSPAEVAVRQERWRSAHQALSQQEASLIAMRTAEDTALQNGQQYINSGAQLPVQTGYPIIDRPGNWIAGQLGNTAATTNQSTQGTFATETARVLGGSPQQTGVLSDAAREHWLRVIDTGANQAQRLAALTQLHIDMDNAINARQGNLEQGYRNLEAGRPIGWRPPAATPQQIGASIPSFAASAMAGASADRPPILGARGGGTPATGGAGGSGPDDGLTVDVVGGRNPANISEASPEWRAAFDRARSSNPGLTFGEFVSIARRVSGPVPSGGIGDLRGPTADPSRQILENFTNQNVPILGPISQAVQAAGGPESANAFLHGGQDLALFGGRDELASRLNSVLGNGTYDQNQERQRAMDSYDNQNHFAARLGGQMAAGLPMALLPGSMGAQMLRNGAQGAAYGLGSGEGDLSQRAPNAVLGGTVGALAPPILGGAGALVRGAGRGTGAAARWLLNRAGAPQITEEGAQIAQAANAEGIPISRPIVDPSARPTARALNNSVVGGMVRGPLDDTSSAIEQRVGQLSPGTPSDPGAMGQGVQQAVNASHQQAGARIGAIYDRAAQMASDAGNPTILPRAALETLDQHIAQLSENPQSNAQVLNYLNGVRADLTDQSGNLAPKSIAALRDLRTGLSGNINQANLGTTNAERIMGDVLDAAGTDVARDLGQSAPGALKLYNQADRLWAQRAQAGRQIVDTLTGRQNNPINGVAVMQKISNMARGDVPRLQQMWGMLDPQMQRDTAATIAQAAGTPTPGGAFSPAAFVKWASSLPSGSRATIFGPDGARSIANLQIVSQALADTQRAVGSQNPVAAALKSTLGGLFTGVASGVGASAVSGEGLLTGGAAAAGLGLNTGIKALSARSLMSPDMTNWLRVASGANSPSAIARSISGLRLVAQRDPAVAQDALGLQQMLTARLSGNISAAAASGAGDQPQGSYAQPGNPPRQR